MAKQLGLGRRIARRIRSATRDGNHQLVAQLLDLQFGRRTSRDERRVHSDEAYIAARARQSPCNHLFD